MRDHLMRDHVMRDHAMRDHMVKDQMMKVTLIIHHLMRDHPVERPHDEGPPWWKFTWPDEGPPWWEFTWWRTMWWDWETPWWVTVQWDFTWWGTTLMGDHGMFKFNVALRPHRPSGLLGTGSPSVTQYGVGLDYYWRLSCTRYCRVVSSHYFACQPDRKRTQRWPSRRFHQARVVTANSLGQIGAASGHKSLLSTKRIGGIVSSTDLIARFTLSDHLDSDSNTPRVSN